MVSSAPQPQPQPQPPAAGDPPSDPAPRLSFVIPAHEEERQLPATLRAIETAAASLAFPYEVVVADDASSDRTAEVAREHGARVISIDRRQIAAARNAGAVAAEGEWLIFVDADTQVTADAVTAAVRALEAGVVGGGATFRFDGPIPLWSRVFLPIFLFLVRRLRVAPGCYVFARRDAFEKIGGFDESAFAGEELVLSRALARQGRFVIVRAHVITSARKLRTHSMLEVFWPVVKLSLFGRRARADRSKLDLWYGERREDPYEESAESGPTSTDGKRD